MEERVVGVAGLGGVVECVCDVLVCCVVYLIMRAAMLLIGDPRE